MRKIEKQFESIWSRAESYNKAKGTRFFKLYDTYKRYITMGIYDSVTKRWVTFDTINLVGNYRYDPRTIPPELEEMSRMVP